MAANSHAVTLNQGSMTVQQTINAAPGQDEGAVGDAAAASFDDWHSSQNEMMLNQLVPRLGGAQ
jgi:hypothetical protein